MEADGKALGEEYKNISNDKYGILFRPPNESSVRPLRPVLSLQTSRASSSATSAPE